MSNAALHVARTGLDAQNARMRVIANNLANVNTTGFKRDRAEFETLAYQTMTAPGAPASGENLYAVGLSLGSGVSMTGTTCAACSCDVTATIGCENVTDKSGARFISPSGEKRTTSRVFPVFIFGVPRWSSDGNLTGIILPVFGAGKVPKRLAKSVLSSVCSLIGGMRFKRLDVSFSESASVFAGNCFSRVSAPASPSLRRNFSPSGMSVIFVADRVLPRSVWAFASKTKRFPIGAINPK